MINNLMEYARLVRAQENKARLAEIKTVDLAPFNRPVIGYDFGSNDESCVMLGEVMDGILLITDIFHSPAPKICISCGSATQPCCGH